MSRVGKQHIMIPPKTEVSVSAASVHVKGPLGELSRGYRPEDVAIEVVDGGVKVTPKRASKISRSLWGTYASHIDNMIAGVNTPFQKKLILEGVGYRMEVRGKELALSVGFSHPVSLAIPEGLTVTVEKSELTISGSDKEMVGQFAADVRAIKKPEPYKGKGIRYENEIIRRKQGKRAVT